MFSRFAMVLCSVALLGLGNGAFPEDAPAKPKSHLVTSGPFEVTATFDGWVQSLGTTEVVLQPEEWSAFTVESAVEAGTSVKAGDTLVTFDSRGIDREIDDLKHQIIAGELGIKLAQIELEVLNKSIPFDIEAAERSALVAKEEWEYYQKLGETLEKETTAENLKNIRETLDGSREELSQLEKMYKADDLTEETEEIILKRARREVERGEFLLKVSQVHHDRRLQEELPRERRQKEIANDREAQSLAKTRVTLPLTLHQKKVELEKLSHAQKHLAERLARLQKDRGLMTVKAPIDGRAMYGEIERGRWVTADAMKGNLRRGGAISANQVIYTLVPPAGSFVHIDIPEKDRGILQTGLLGRITPTANPSSLIPCELKAFSVGFVKEGTFGGFVEAPAASPETKGLPTITGMTVKVRLMVFTENNVVTVPSAAVFTDDDDPQLKHVWLVTADAEPKKHPVEIGLSSVTRTHIKTGLKSGDQILLTKPEGK